MLRNLLLAIGTLTAALCAQESSVAPIATIEPANPSGKPADPGAPARLEGMVINDSTGAPLRRAHIVLHPLEAGLSATGSDADDEGHFLLRNIPPGLYSLSAERDGFLTSTQPLTGGLRMPPSFRLNPGDRITDLGFRLRPWAVMYGRVRYADGEFGVGVRVQLYRTDHIRGRSAYSLAASTVANDRGEYRIYGLSPGGYLVAAEYDPPSTPNYREQPVTERDGRELPAIGYTTTFYPNTELMSQAVPVRLNYGEELGGIDLYLRQARKLTLRGRVLDGMTGLRLSSANISLERVDQSGHGTMSTNARATFDRNGDFQIPGVSPGSYGVFVRAAGEDGALLTGRTLLVVGSDDIDNLDLIANPAEKWPGRVVTEGPGIGLTANDAIKITLEPRSMNAAPCSASPRRVAPGNDALGFDTCTVQRDETYDVFADNLPGDYYLSAVRVGGTDVKAVGLPGSVLSEVPFDVVLDSRGGRVSGVVAGTDGALWGGASLMLIPDPPARRLQDYRFVSADANGRYLFRGVAPGNYILAGWLDQVPCDVYDPDGLDRCRATGASVTVHEAAEQDLLLTIRTLPQP